MEITYRESQPRTSGTPFVIFDTGDRDRVIATLIRWSTMIMQSTIVYTQHDRDMLEVVLTADRAVWGISQQHGRQANTMLSVLGGIIDKLQNGGDLTLKQFEMLKNIQTVMQAFDDQHDSWQFHRSLYDYDV